MAVAIENTSNRGELFVRGIEKSMSMAQIEYPEKMREVFQMQSVGFGDKTILMRSQSGAVRTPLIAEGQTIPLATRYPLYATEFTRKKYAQALTITEELINDIKANKSSLILQNLFDQSTTLMNSRNRAATFTRANIFNNGYDTSYTSYGDAKPLFSTIHPRKDGGTAQSNASSTGVTLGNDNLADAIVAMRGQLNDVGELIDNPVDKLILLVAPANEDLAKRILFSSGRQGTNDNDLNTFSRIELMVIDELSTTSGGSDTAWFLINPNKSQLRFFSMGEMSVKMKDDTTNDTITVSLRDYWDAGWTDWRFLWGSKGDGAAYSS